MTFSPLPRVTFRLSPNMAFTPPCQKTFFLTHYNSHITFKMAVYTNLSLPPPTHQVTSTLSLQLMAVITIYHMTFTLTSIIRMTFTIFLHTTFMLFPQLTSTLTTQMVFTLITHMTFTLITHTTSALILHSTIKPNLQLTVNSPIFTIHIVHSYMSHAMTHRLIFIKWNHRLHLTQAP